MTLRPKKLNAPIENMMAKQDPKTVGVEIICRHPRGISKYGEVLWKKKCRNGIAARVVIIPKNPSSETAARGSTLYRAMIFSSTTCRSTLLDIANLRIAMP